MKFFSPKKHNIEVPVKYISPVKAEEIYLKDLPPDIQKKIQENVKYNLLFQYKSDEDNGEENTMIKFKNGIARVHEINNIGRTIDSYLTINGEIKVRDKYITSEDFQDGQAIVFTKNRKYKILDSEFKEYPTKGYIELHRISKNFYIGCNEKGWAWIDSNYNEYNLGKYESIRPPLTGLGLSVCKKKSGSTVIVSKTYFSEYSQDIIKVEQTITHSPEQKRKANLIYKINYKYISEEIKQFNFFDIAGLVSEEDGRRLQDIFVNLNTEGISLQTFKEIYIKSMESHGERQKTIVESLEELNQYIP